MKPKPMNPEIWFALAKIERIADRLASTFCTSSKLCEEGYETLDACLDNLDQVASATTLAELEDAPAMLNGVARSFRHVFHPLTTGWDDAATITNVAFLISEELNTSKISNP
jgi:hypothetical protein